MMFSHNSNEGETQIPIGAALVVAAMAAVAAGLVLPLLIGFSPTQMIILATVEVACLGMLASGVIIMSQRLRASHQALWELARRDELTGVGNYRGLHERLAEEIPRHGRRSRSFALILLDLNGFKQINEAHGHLEGDRLLAEIGSALSDEVRHEDAVFRQGGDEFAVIVPETDAEGAREVAERLRERVRRRGFGNDQARPVSAASGAAIFPDDGTTGDDLLGAADRALFAAKRDKSPA